MKALAVEALLELRDTGRKLLGSAEELVEKHFRRHGQAATVGHAEHVHEFLVGGSVHSPEHRARGRFT